MSLKVISAICLLSFQWFFCFSAESNIRRMVKKKEPKSLKNFVIEDPRFIRYPIAYPFYERQLETENQTNSLMILNSGLTSFQKRIDLIRNAQNTIEAEYFIWGLDQSSRIFTQELIKAAKRNVKVRILVDKSIAVFQLNKFIARELKAFGIEVKYYNSAPLFNLGTIQFRNHRKLLIVDDKKVILGGRNIGNEYFDLSDTFNFHDRDVLVEGSIVPVIRKSFDLFFLNEMSEYPNQIIEPEIELTEKHDREFYEFYLESEDYRLIDEAEKFQEKLEFAKKFVSQHKEDDELLNRIENITREEIQSLKKHDCPDLSFVSDSPGASFLDGQLYSYGNEFRNVRKVVNQRVTRVNKRAIFSSPYMIHNERSKKVLEHILDKDVEVQLYTNSLASTDAVYVAANLYRHVFDWVDNGIEVFLHNGQFHRELFSNQNDAEKKMSSSKWGMHSKSHYYESVNESGETVSEIMIGTYNIDNRSNFYNTELAIFCRGNQSLSNELLANLKYRMQKGYKLKPGEKAVDKDGAEVNVLGFDPQNENLMKLLAIPSYLLKDLL
jgi:putative cardiolipin synthase